MEDGIVCVGDMTDHGGVVVEGIPGTEINGRQIAGMGNMVLCPKCKGSFPISEGNTGYMVNGRPVAQHGMKTACGAVLLAGNLNARVHR